MSTSFDAIAALFDGSDFNFGKASGQPKGVNGAREWAFHLDAADRDLLDDADSFAEYLAGDTGVEVQVFHSSTVEGDSDDQSDEHTHIIGHLDPDPAKCWAMQVKATLPHIEDFDTSAQFLLIENPAKIKFLTGQKEDEELAAVARSVISTVNGYSGGDREKMLGLFAAIVAQPDGAFMRVLEAKFNGSSLDEATPQSTSRKPSPRI